MTISKTKSGKYHASIIIEEEHEITPLPRVLHENIAAFDMSASEFLVGEEEVFSNPRFYRRSEPKLRKLHRQVSRKKKGSHNREKARLKLSNSYEKIANQKRD
ncbi:MAG: transposase [Promethearchaeota archaeon]